MLKFRTTYESKVTEGTLPLRVPHLQMFANVGNVVTKRSHAISGIVLRERQTYHDHQKPQCTIVRTVIVHSVCVAPEPAACTRAGTRAQATRALWVKPGLEDTAVWDGFATSLRTDTSSEVLAEEFGPSVEGCAFATVHARRRSAIKSVGYSVSRAVVAGTLPDNKTFIEDMVFTSLTKN